MKLIDDINTWLSNPDTSDIEKAKEKTNYLVVEAVELMKSNPEFNSDLGPLVGRLKSLRNHLSNVELVQWVNVGDGYLALGHRPGAKLVGDLKLQGATHLFTLLSESEEALQYEQLANKKDMEWIWFPMTSAQAPDSTRLNELKTVFMELQSALNKGAKVYVHCSAGIHRTGMITYTFLRFLGMSESESEATLANLRTVTSEGVGDHRKAWGEELISNLK